ncbi:hypothetical protein CERZMDRAFT_114171 [Cercospora zeae-maydis SCOH1-5]|uniref:Uncharacterized protein n=1 Tax=Cercospora zeae-maydis SCOH1-5 TaxID=717836 RepID=A0A6A6F535_9PEZI|nr:hypothetical protein CERZMDRAFT_114171 [Cercospora zeae-maydis SCOH1-5]
MSSSGIFTHSCSSSVTPGHAGPRVCAVAVSLAEAYRDQTPANSLNFQRPEVAVDPGYHQTNVNANRPRPIHTTACCSCITPEVT